MGKFLDQVRRGKVRQPRHQAFDPSAWRSAFETLRSDTVDDELFEAGLWFHARLPVLWDRAKRAAAGLSWPMLLQALCGAANLESAVAQRELLEEAKQYGAVPRFAHSLFQQKIVLASGTEVTADQVFSSIGDALSLGLNYLFRKVPEGGAADAIVRTEATGLPIRELLRSFQIIEIFENDWSRCLYLDMQLTQGETRAVFRYRDKAIPVAVAVADHQSRSREINSAMALREFCRSVASD